MTIRGCWDFRDCRLSVLGNRVEGLGVVSLTTTAFERSALEAVLLGKKATYKPLIVEMMPATQSGNSKP